MAYIAQISFSMSFLNIFLFFFLDSRLFINIVDTFIIIVMVMVMVMVMVLVVVMVMVMVIVMVVVCKVCTSKLRSRFVGKGLEFNQSCLNQNYGHRR